MDFRTAELRRLAILDRRVGTVVDVAVRRVDGAPSSDPSYMLIEIDPRQTVEGTVIALRRGFGFLRIAAGSEVFFAGSDVVGGFGSLAVGDRVSCRVIPAVPRERAVDVERMNA